MLRVMVRVSFTARVTAPRMTRVGLLRGLVLGLGLNLGLSVEQGIGLWLWLGLWLWIGLG